MSATTINLGVAGLGRAFMLMLPTFIADPRIRLVVCADPRADARARFEAECGGRSHESVDALCADPAVDVVYLSTPHQFHAAHVVAAARHGKHVVVEKPMAITLEECAAMIDAASRAGIQLIVGHSHSFDAPVLRAREHIAAATYGQLRMITAIHYTDFLYRPRRPEELDTAQGGGVVFSQGVHQVDIARLLGGGRARSVRAHTGAWDRTRGTEGAYSALLAFESGAFATLVYSGYAHYDSDELSGWISEMGHPKDPAKYWTTRASLQRATQRGSQAQDETALKYTRAYGTGSIDARPAAGHNHFGMIVASCDRADLRPLPNGVMIYADDAAQLDPVALPSVPRVEVIDELADAISGKRPAVHNGEWAMATLEVCLAILESSRAGREVMLRHQVSVPSIAVETSAVTP